jgi:hypothetical protein
VLRWIRNTHYGVVQITTRKFAFSNRFGNRNISVALATDLETDILSSKSKNNRSLNRLLYKYSDRIRDRYLATNVSVALETDLETVIYPLGSGGPSPHILN